MNMPATLSHLSTNFDRVRENAGASEGARLIAKMLEAITMDDPTATPHQVWEQLIKAADAAHVANSLPGTVGRHYGEAYGLIKKRGPRKAKADHGAVRTVQLTPASMKTLQEHGKDLLIKDSVLHYDDRGVSQVQAVIDALPKSASNARRALEAVLRKM